MSDAFSSRVVLVDDGAGCVYIKQHAVLYQITTTVPLSLRRMRPARLGHCLCPGTKHRRLNRPSVMHAMSGRCIVERSVPAMLGAG